MNFYLGVKKIEKIYTEKDKYFGVVPMKVINPIEYSPFVAPVLLKEKFINDTKEFLSNHNLKGNSNFKTEILMILHRLKNSNTDGDALIKLKTNIKQLDAQRGSDITKFIPNFYEYI